MIALDYSNNNIQASYISNAKDFDIPDSTVVTNMSVHPCKLADGSLLLAGESSIYRSTRVIDGSHLCFHRVLSEEDLARVCLSTTWQSVAQAFPDADIPETTPLWRSSKQKIATVEMNISQLVGQVDQNLACLAYDLTVNLWYAPPHTNCLIHRIHSFFELHTQIAGYGRMQKFLDQDPSTLYEDVMLSPGQTHRSFAHTITGEQFQYPWHQYYADTACVWLAVEYHPITSTT